jgi:hypothetical protein
LWRESAGAPAATTFACMHACSERSCDMVSTGAQALACRTHEKEAVADTEDHQRDPVHAAPEQEPQRGGRTDAAVATDTVSRRPRTKAESQQLTRHICKRRWQPNPPYPRS